LQPVSAACPQGSARWVLISVGKSAVHFMSVRHAAERTGEHSGTNRRTLLKWGRGIDLVVRAGDAQPAGNCSAWHLWCERRDSNSHTLRRRNLNPLRLPIPPRSLLVLSTPVSL